MQIDSHHFWRYDAVRDAWITDEMRVLQRDFLPEHLEPDAGANGMDATVVDHIAKPAIAAGEIAAGQIDNWELV